VPGQPPGGQDEIAAAKRELGRQFRAWRLRAGFTQEELAARTGYRRPAIRNAEGGISRARPLFEAADKATGAAGVLLAARDQTDAFINAARQEATRQARAALAQPAAGMSSAEPEAVTLVILHCPHCGTSLPATVSIHLAAAMPVTAPGPVRP
jgi:transcriptional regulator with XRE-family HTH domain